MVCTLNRVGVSKANYYTEVIARDDYYQDGGEAPGRWYGEAAKIFGLENWEIGNKDKSFRNLMIGKDPVSGEQLRNVSLKVREYKETDRLTGQTKITRSEPKLAWDFTLSTPKSVSVLWGVSDDQTRAAIEAAQRKAVETTIAAIEERASFTRTGEGGAVQEPMKLAFAAFDHTTSRALDPHLHTHILLVNTGLREDGRGGAVDMGQIFTTKVHTFGAIHMNALAYELQKLGIQLRDCQMRNGKSFEVIGIPESLLEESSKRRAEIKGQVAAKEAELGRKLNSYENDAVFRKTRETKHHVEKDALRLAWQDDARAHGFDYKQVINHEPCQWRRQERKEFLHSFTRSLSYKDRITESELLRTALYHSKGQLSQDDIGKFIQSYKTTHLQQIGNHEKHGQIYTLNTIGLQAASQQSRYQEFRYAVNRLVSDFRSWRYEQRTKAYERKQKAFKRRITFLHLIGKIDRATYKRLVQQQGLPKTKASIQWEYATHQISAKYRDHLLRHVDPRQIAARQEREALIERYEQERQRKAAQQRERIQRVSLHRSTDERKALAEGKVRLWVVERNLERDGKLPRGTSDKERKLDRERQQLERDRLADLKKKGLLSTRDETEILAGRIRLNDLESHLFRHGKLDKLPPLVLITETENRRMAWLEKHGLLSTKDREVIELGLETVAHRERMLQIQGKLTLKGRIPEPKKEPRNLTLDGQKTPGRALHKPQKQHNREAKGQTEIGKIERIRIEREAARVVKEAEAAERIQAAREVRQEQKKAKAEAQRQAIEKARQERQAAKEQEAARLEEMRRQQEEAKREVQAEREREEEPSLGL